MLQQCKELESTKYGYLFKSKNHKTKFGQVLEMTN